MSGLVEFSDAVQVAVRRTFPEGVWSDAFAALPESSSFPSGAPVERVLVAVVELASGDIAKLAHFSARAKSDWRDVLYWRENPPASDEPASYEELRRRLGLPDDGEH